MSRRLRPAVTIVIAFSALAFVRAPASNGRFDPALRAIERALSARPPMPGIVIGITDRERVVKLFAHGYGNLETRAPVTTSSLFEIGSIGKSFTAIALMQLMDEGRFDPQAPITRYLPWFELHGNDPPVTGHHLLSHTAGIPNYRAEAASAAYATYALREFEPAYPPGAHFWYSNTGFQTLGYVLEAIEDAPYRSIVERRIFRRVGMRSSIPLITDAVRSRLPASYVAEACGAGYLEQPWFEYRAADGSIISSAEDMLAYARMILNRGAIEGGRLISERAFTLLTTPVQENYAYGLRVRTQGDDLQVGHSGAIAGFRAGMVAHMNDGFAMVFLGNGPIDQKFAQWITTAVRSALKDQAIPAAPAAPTSEAARKAQAAFAGSYSSPDGTALEFENTGTGLVLRRAGRTVPLRQLGPATFCSPDPDLTNYPFVFEQRGGTTVAVSHGPDWFAGKAYVGPRTFAVPEEYLPLVGRYESHDPEGAPLRVFVRNGQLVAASGYSEAIPLVKVAANVFRPAQPDYNPERFVFDAFAGGHALRLRVSGEPMYRIDDR